MIETMVVHTKRRPFQDKIRNKLLEHHIKVDQTVQDQMVQDELIGKMRLFALI